MEMTEKGIERLLKRRVEKGMGGLALKLVSPGMVGVPDRLILLPNGKAAFVELKAPGEKPRPIQLYAHDKLRGLGFPVYVVDSAEGVGRLLHELEGGDVK